MQTYIALTFNMQVRRFQRGLLQPVRLQCHHKVSGSLPAEGPPGERAEIGLQGGDKGQRRGGCVENYPWLWVEHVNMPSGKGAEDTNFNGYTCTGKFWKRAMSEVRSEPKACFWASLIPPKGF